ncbi:hypothetical protein FACS1894120_1490 [Clostridia bacterium]|nr:hypothetical protein FACS1894120_1490 [Clostridia bacterium]
MANTYSLSVSRAVRAKLLTVYGRRLTDTELVSLMNCESVRAAVRLLSGTMRYAGLFDAAAEAGAHRGLIEDLIRKDEMLLFERLSGFIPWGKNDFFSFFTRRVEIEIILSSVMFISISDFDKLVTSLPVYLVGHLSFDVTEIAKSKNLESFLKVMAHTGYIKVLERHISPDPAGKISFEKLSHDLYDEYYNWQFACVDLNMSGKERLTLQRLISISLDVENLRTCYRMKKYFGRSGDDILKSIIQPAKFLNETRRRLLSENTPPEEVLAELERRYFKGKAGNAEKNLEMAIRRYKKMLYGKLVYAAESGTVALYAFSKILEVERQNVITVVESIRYEVPLEYIKNLVTLELP